MNAFIMGLFFLIPGNTEVFAGAVQHISHVELQTIYLDIQRKRDTAYILSAATIMLSYTMIPKCLLLVCFGTVVGSLLHYFYVVHKVYPLL